MISRGERRRRVIAEAGEVLARARQERDEPLTRAGGGRAAAAAAAGAAAWPGELRRAAEVAENYLRWPPGEGQQGGRGSAGARS
ncbi:MAG TPA: hypothetical protein VH307_20375 [Streptosporangiaceae bacterium]|jgi:hypothetical protein|nr:hypothetical protein [Streptosporangiaceae bacterium]